MIQNEEFIQEFVDEARGHVETLESVLIRVEDMKSDPELVNEVFRAVHSIKGTAGFFGLKNIVSLAHAMENVFGEMRNGNIVMNDDIADLMLKSNDRLNELVENVCESENTTVDTYITDLNNLLKSAGQTDSHGKSTEIAAKNGADKKITLYGSNGLIIDDGIKQGHNIYEIKLRFNHDLLDYDNGPVRLFKNIQQVGQLVDTIVDHSEINSFDDVIASINGSGNDVYLGIVVTTGLDAEALSEAIHIPKSNIISMNLNNPKAADSCTAVSEPAASKAVAAKDIKANLQEAPASHISGTVPNPKQAPSGNKSEAKTHAPSFKLDDSIRVNVQILNDLLNMASEMVLGRNQLLRTLENYKKSIPGLAPILQNIDRLTSGLQEKIMQTRMQPVANVFTKFPRIIRDISKKLSKEIELKIEGSDVELDKSMIEALGDPLTHLVRNSADHGLESPEKREQAGKSRIGTISLKAYHEGGFVNIDVSDDGSGLDLEKIKKKAVESGICSRTEIESMSEQELFRIIFKPGFSTAEKVTDISGRGVGMDVVKTNIEKLGGSIEIYSTSGKGTTIRLVLPLTLAIIQSLIVSTSGQIYALPQVNMKEIVRIKEGDSKKIEHINGADVIRLRGTLLPIVYLADILDRSKGNKASGTKSKAPIIIVFKTGAIRFGIAVDSITESEETLVKPLPQALKGCICYSGVTIMGDGKAAMILDPEGIIKAAELNNSAELLDENADASEEAAMDEEQQSLLMFKCSGNETFAIDMSLVARVEEITPEQIEKVGNKEFLHYRDNSLRILRPEDFLPVNRAETADEKMYVIIPKLVSHPIGILVKKIVDNVRLNVQLSMDDVKTKGILGSTIYNNGIVLLLQPYELFTLADPVHYPSITKKIDRELNLLVAEDTPFFQRILKEDLIAAGYNVTVVQNGKVAWELLNQRKFDAVISDINMPVMDGFELVRRIKDKPELTAIPVVALTALTGEKNKDIGIKSGFDYYECKLDRENLLKTLDTIFNKVYGGEMAC